MTEGAKLTEQELREAAAEAGISPEELRRALVQRSSPAPSTALARAERVSAALAPYSAETQLAMPPDHALDVVRRALARQVGNSGHRQGSGRADIVDERAGVVYKISSAGDGQGGALVKVEVDAGAGRSNLALGGFILGGFALGITAFGALLSSLIMWGGLSLGVLGAVALFVAGARLETGRKHAEQVVAQALLEAEETPAVGPGEAPRALPPL